MARVTPQFPVPADALVSGIYSQLTTTGALGSGEGVTRHSGARVSRLFYLLRPLEVVVGGAGWICQDDPFHVSMRLCPTSEEL